MLKPQLTRTLTILVALLLCSAAAIAKAGPRPQGAQLPGNPGDLVRNIIERELTLTQAEGPFTWREREQKPARTLVKQLVETPEGILSRVMTINDRPLSAEERRKDDERINRLLDPEKMREKVKEQKQDQERTTKMLRALPDAFDFQYERTETAPNGHTIVHLRFTPKPNFDPPSRESLVFTAMSGVMTIDTTAQHVMKIDGTLFKDISIGWGLIGHLDRGGRFIIQQAEVLPGHWDLTRLVLDFTGKALIFKSIKIKQENTAYDFRPVPRMNVAEALDFLRKQDASTAINAQAASPR
ncbi:MAG TPA: hypothetical protein VEG32_06785 [Clostridia bacterium]|nr:hypothetical protein [Clostridia bacterium]